MHTSATTASSEPMAEMNPPRATTGQDPHQLLNSLQTLWTKTKMQELREHARQGFAGMAEPLSELLDMLEACNNGKGKANSLGHFIASEFQRWIEQQPHVEQSVLRLKKLQARVFSLVSEGKTNVVDPLIAIYQLNQADRDFLLGHISHLYLKGKYKEAAVLSTKLHLQPDLDVEKMCAPLYLLDKTNLMEAYVADHPELQCRLLQMLDRWSMPDFSLSDVTRLYPGLPRIRQDKLNHKLLSKLVFRLLEQYHLQPDLCPNVINQRHLGTLKYLFYKRFVEKSMTHENWSDHVQSTVGQNPWLQEQLLKLLVRHSDTETVARWALRYNLPEEKLPYGVADKLQSLRLHERLDVEEKSPDDFQSRKRNYYQLPIPRENILLPHSVAELEECMRVVLKPGQVVGIDMEWRPSFGVLEKSRVSLIQMAVKDRIFLLDLLQLLKEVDGKGSELANFITAVFTDPTITKLGYGMTGDLNSLVLTCPSLKDLHKHVKKMLDLLTVDKLLQKCNTRMRDGTRFVDVLSELPGSSDQGYKQPEKGLSMLVQHVLGKPLDKTQQLSNWEKRPLREEQIVYAACDAYCLLDVYETLCADPARYGLSLNLADCFSGNQSLKPKAEKLKRKPETPSLKHQKPEPAVEAASTHRLPVSPREFSVVCDNMLQGLGRYLRCLGVDVRILENDDDHRKAAELARREARVILTCGLPYQTLRSQVGEGKCFSVDCAEKAKEQAIRVLKHFNVRVTLSDVFSRCQACNCNKYLKISNQKMRHLMVLSGVLGPVTSTELKDPEDGPVSRPRAEAISSAAPEWNSNSPQGFVYNPACQWAEEQDFSLDSVVLESGAALQISAIPPGLLDRVDLFYCCSQCGKVFWEGSHFGRVISQFEELLHGTSGEGFYQMHAGDPSL